MQPKEEPELDNILTKHDFNRIRAAASRPLFVLETISQMLRAYGEKLDRKVYSKLHGNIIALYTPYSEVERINLNPMGFAYVVHLRLLLMTYLTSLPLALVEQMGYATIPVFWVIAYSLMSLEMLAVEVENPFGYQGSDLRLFKYNTVLKDTVLESWHFWLKDTGSEIQNDEEELKYERFGQEEEEEPIMHEWFDYW